MHRRRDQARRSRDEEQFDDVREAADQQVRPAAADRVLALQSIAGNRAVSAVLARSPDTAKPEEKTESSEASGARDAPRHRHDRARVRPVRSRRAGRARSAA
jgi:hypothetical protein